jgi:serine/threonine protein kinase
MSLIINKKYEIIEKLGEGAFGKIFLGKNIITQEKIAVKLDEGDKTMLKNEAILYNYLSNISGIPKLYNYGNEGNFNYIVLELLGKTLEDYKIECNNKFSLQTVLALGIQMLSRVESIHNKGIIHRDIKPENFLMGTNANNEILYLIDFGLAKSYLKNDKHIIKETQKTLIGTARYVSINVHNGISPSRRDDIESIGYLLVYFLCGNLPWQGLKATNKVKKQEKIGKIKKEYKFWENNELPGEIILFINYARNLEFEEKPNYLYLKNLLLNLYKQKQYKISEYYDWLK